MPNPLVNPTHDPELRSWVGSANDRATDFPIQNLPFGRFRAAEGDRTGVAIGELIVDLTGASAAGLFAGAAAEAAKAGAQGLDQLARLGLPAASALRFALSTMLVDGSRHRTGIEPFLREQRGTDMLLPMPVRHFTDMCVSTFHIGRRRGTDSNGQPLCPPAMRHIPVGYDGRPGSVVVSGSPVRRPWGTWQHPEGEGEPQFGPEPRLDYELEIGIWLAGTGKDGGSTTTIGEASEAIFGYGLLNDWSARGIQFFETMLGPFLGKSIATTVSPWIVTSEAVAPFRIPAFVRPPCDPPVPVHLDDADDRHAGGLAIALEAAIESAAMREAGLPPHRVCATDFRHMYWTPAQMIAHHASNGCVVAAGDLIGTGTCSGPDPAEAACLLERNFGGPWQLPGGETRGWLEDGDRVLLRGRLERPGYVPIGLGTAEGLIEPALQVFG